MRDTTRKIIMICSVIALLLTMGTQIFASPIGATPINKRNGVMDKIRGKVEDAVRDSDTSTNDTGSGTVTDNSGTVTDTGSGTDSQTGSADPLTSTAPETTRPETTDPETTTAENSDVLEDENGGFNWWGILIAVAIAAAVVILIIALLPKK